MSQPRPFSLYSTLTRTTRPFEPIEPGKVGLYVCGMTVYDRCHVGHARAMVVFDSFSRWLRHNGWDLTFVRNFTDVDDKIIARANERGEDPAELAQRYIDAFHEDSDALGLLRPDHEPRVSESIDIIIRLTSQLIDRGHAYASEGSVFFDVRTFDDYGKLSGQNIDALRGADTDAGKRDPADFALWKAQKPGEPAWPSPWGPGRPGWHIECSAMSWLKLGVSFDIHGGGLDLIFPHHENEIAQSECAHGEPFANYWMHNGLLTMESGQKMGKSLGNVINVEDAIARFPAQALRLYYLQNHYRSPLPWGENALPEALHMVSRLYEAKEAAEAMQGSEDPDQLAKDLGPDAQKVLELGRAFPDRYNASLDEDFNTSLGLGHLFELARAINRFANHKRAKKRGGPIVAPALQAFALVASSTGLMEQETHAFLEEVRLKRLNALGLDRADIDRLVSEREQFRQEKNWAESDRIRDTLSDQGILVMDGPDGVEWRVRISDPS